MSCFKVSNNKYFNCPARMSDGSLFTDYRQNCIINSNKYLNSYEYRMYLINNAENLMNRNRLNISNVASCNNCKQPYNKGTMLNECTMQVCNKRTCKVKIKDPKGVGRGREYNKEPSQCNDWPKNFPVNNSPNCCAGKGNLNNYGINGRKTIERNAQPSGGRPGNGGDIRAYNF